MKTCDEIRQLLPLELSGDLDGGETEAVRRHVEECNACREDRFELESTRRLLDTVPVPNAPSVEVTAIYSAALDRHIRTARHWRRLAVAAAALAAGVMIAVALPRLEIRFGGQELVVRWGTTAPLPPPSPPVESSLLARLDRLETHLNQPAVPDPRYAELQDLLLTLAADVDERDRRQRDELTAAVRQIVLLDSATREQFRRSEQTSAALYTLITDRTRPEGGKP